MFMRNRAEIWFGKHYSQIKKNAELTLGMLKYTLAVGVRSMHTNIVHTYMHTISRNKKKNKQAGDYALPRKGSAALNTIEC